MQERRRFTRWQLNWPAQARLSVEEPYCPCTVKDINYKGLQVYLQQKLKKDSFFTLSIVLSEDCVLNIEAWVAWHRVLVDIDIYGLYFEKISDGDKEKIYQFIKKHFPQQIYKQWWRGLSQEEGGEIMPRQEFEDRRIFARFPMELPLRFLNLGANREGYGQTQDLSAKGIGMVTQEELSPNATVEMWLEIPDRGEPLYSRGEVIWSKRIEPNKYRTGVNLEKADLMGMSRTLRAI